MRFFGQHATQVFAAPRCFYPRIGVENALKEGHTQEVFLFPNRHRNRLHVQDVVNENHSNRLNKAPMLLDPGIAEPSSAPYLAWELPPGLQANEETGVGYD